MTSLPPPIQAVVALFRGPLAGIRFADVDATGLTNLAAEVESATAEIEAQEAKLAELKQMMAQRSEALVALAQQALAYARIYAENDEVLSAELSQIVLPRATKPRKATKPASEAATPVEPTMSDAAAVDASESRAEAAADSAAIEAEADADATEAEAESKPRLQSKPKKKYSRVPPQSRAS